MTAPVRPPGIVLAPSFPADDYTPHGYIDNPHHSMVLTRSGVIRSVPPLGFGYWLRPFRGSYGSGVRGHVNYLSLLNFGVTVGDVHLETAGDFARQGVCLVSRYHTKHLVSYDFTLAGLRFSLKYWLAREHSLACAVEVENTGAASQAAALRVTHTYGLWETKWWGSNGLAARHVPEDDAIVSAIWAYGDYFALGADRPLSAADLQKFPAGCHGPGPLETVRSIELQVSAHSTESLLLCLARGPNEGAALDELRAALHDAIPAANAQLAHDEAFWAGCPRLEGDWPEHWRRGWVYDWETLRMNVRPPLGIYKHPWDAMQIHSPRSVLGEASVDMLCLHYADSHIAQEVLFGTFADAPAPNVPCGREDGSMNMIAADGSACGTAPSWCFPFHVIRTIHATTGDDGWLRRLYPYLKTYLEWWFTHRMDADGWFHCKCDWESGQDGSKRFLQPQGEEGGVAEYVRTVDVEASVAEACRNMVLFARIAGWPEDAPRWAALAERRSAAVRSMFVDGWFRDFDCRTNRPILLTDWTDIMMLAPLTCGIASAEQVAALRPKFQWFRENPAIWLEWGSFFLVFGEAAWFAGLQTLYAEQIADTVDRVYTRTDARKLHFEDPAQPYTYRVPGVACEYWPVREDLEPGGEGYGWGATLPLHVIRGIVGFRESDDVPAEEFILAPALPERLRVAGRRYAMRNLHYRGLTIGIEYRVLDGTRLALELTYRSSRPVTLTLAVRGGTAPTVAAGPATTGTLTAEVTSGSVYSVRIAE